MASAYRPIESSRLVGVEPLVRIGFADPDCDVEDNGGWMVTPGLMFYVSGKKQARGESRCVLSTGQ